MREDVYYNIGDRPLVIVTCYTADPTGDPAIIENSIMIKPGDGIDVSILGLSKNKTRENERG